MKAKFNFYIQGGGGINIQKAFALKVLLSTYNLTYSDLTADIWNNNSSEYPSVTATDIAGQLKNLCA
jgi:hypothetical protein